MDGLNGADPDESASRCDEYELGWLAGAEDRQNGFQAPAYFGPCELPIRRGAEVVIPKGTKIEHRGIVRESKRDSKVRLHDVYPGGPAYVDYGHSGEKVIRPTAAQVLWAGSGGYWARASLADVLKEDQKVTG